MNTATATATATVTRNANGTATINVVLPDGRTVARSLSAKRTAKGGSLVVLVGRRPEGEWNVWAVQAPKGAAKYMIDWNGHEGAEIVGAAVEV